MSTTYRAVQWTAHKRTYDLVLAGLVGLYLLAFVAVGLWAWPADRQISPPILLLRALGTCAFLMLTVVLCIGPLCRLDRRFLPLLYNRRHLGVATFAVAFFHALIVTGWYHGFGVVNPLASLLTSNTQYASVSGFPFETLGLVALLVLFLLAATSHDFWLHNLSARTWKVLHQLVYVAWAAVIGHVALGALQSEPNPVYVVLVGASVLLVGGLHLAAATRERRRLAAQHLAPTDDTPWLDAGPVATLSDGCGRSVRTADGQRIAVFRHDGRVSAVSNVCAHQGGPLGEGRIVNGCITCPWHGYQYRPHDGQSPPPFTEKLPTYRVRVVDGRVQVDPRPLPPGTAVEPAPIEETRP